MVLVHYWRYACNVLLLRGKMHIAPGTTAISSHELLNNLATIMFELMPQVQSIITHYEIL